MAKHKNLKDLFVEKYLVSILKDASKDKLETLNKNSFKMICQNVKYMTILDNNKLRPASLSDDIALLNYILNNIKNYIFTMPQGKEKILAQEIFNSILFIKNIRLTTNKKSYIESMVNKTLNLIKRL